MTTSYESYRTVLDGILPRVEKPVRYVGGEWNVARKDPEKIRARIALCFPDVYEIGMSHLGLKILYELLNRPEHWSAERGYAGVSMRDIAAAAGLRNQASLYHHFPSKRALYEAVLAHELAPVLALVARAPDTGPSAALADELIHHLAGHPHLPRLIQRLGIDDRRGSSLHPKGTGLALQAEFTHYICAGGPVGHAPHVAPMWRLIIGAKRVSR
jgi:hypothetical protein